MIIIQIKDNSALLSTLPTDESTPGLETVDAFGHERYSFALETLLKTSPQGQTIGLFGGYGTGKTWVIKKLRQILRENGDDPGLIEYDAWRYADDEIRRDFLLQLRQALEVNNLYDGNAPEINPDRFKIEVETTEKGPAKFSWSAFRKGLKDSVLLGLILVSLSALFGLLLGLVIEGFPKGVIYLLTGALGGMSWAGNAFRAMLSIDRFTIKNVQTTSRPRIEFPEEFLNMFETIVGLRKPKVDPISWTMKGPC